MAQVAPGNGRLIPQPLRRIDVLAALATGLGVALIYTLYSVRQWQRIDVPSWDLGIFTQVARGWSQWTLPVAPLKGEGFMILGDHFHPILALLGPIYALFPSGLTLLVVQNLFIGATAAILVACAARYLGTGNGVLLGVGLGLAWGLQTAADSQFHEIAFALPLLAMSLAMLLDGRYWGAAWWALPLVLVKEDMGLTVAAIGVVILIAGGRNFWNRIHSIGAGLTAFGAIFFFLTVRVFLPALNPDGQWDYAEDSTVSLLLSDPGAAIAGLIDGFGTKLLLVFMVFFITGFLALRSPLALITLPTFAWRFTSDVEFHWGTHWHYSAVLMPVVFFALTDTLVRSKRMATFAPFLTTASAALAIILTFSFPLSKLLSSEYWEPSGKEAAAAEIVAFIEADAKVVSDITLMAYLAPHAQVYWLGNDNPVPDYVVLYTDSGVFGDHPPDDAASWALERFPQQQWYELYARDGFSVAVENKATP